MRVAIIGSRDLQVEDFSPYLPEEVTEIISGGARGIDQCARRYAKEKGLKLTEFLPDYAQFGKSAPLRRNLTIIEHADLVLAFWNGTSRGTKFVIDRCRRMNKPLRIFKVKSSIN